MTWPHVAAMMPTRDRPEFVRGAIHTFLDQDYPGVMTLWIVDDGVERAELCECCVAAANRHVILLHMTTPVVLPVKRNAIMRQAAEAARRRGSPSIYVLWDDDDHYGPARVRRQALALLANPSAECCLLRPWTVYDTRRAIVATNVGVDVDGSSAYWLPWWQRVPYDEQIDPYSGPTMLNAQPADKIVRIDAARDYVVVRHGGQRTGEPGASYKGGPWRDTSWTAAEIAERISTSRACRPLRGG